jgi:hypothetical protein
MEDRTWILRYLRIAGASASPQLIADAANEIERLQTIFGHLETKCAYLEAEIARLERLSHG